METIDSHISIHYSQELEDIRSRVLRMGRLVEGQIAGALTAFVDGDPDLGERIADNDTRVDRFEISIDETCNFLLSHAQPAAGELRLIAAVVKTITDLERIGGEAGKIACMAVRHAGDRRLSGGYIEIQHLGTHVRQILHDALNAFSRLDADVALKVIIDAQRISRECGGVMRQLITYMMEDPRTITGVLDVIWSARALERIGDHARNICEYIIYLVKGKDVRHTSLEQMEQEVR
jgi:phosphate transport system protein